MDWDQESSLIKCIVARFFICIIVEEISTFLSVGKYVTVLSSSVHTVVNAFGTAKQWWAETV